MTNITTAKIKEMMDACYQTKRIHDLLPQLPDGIAPSYIHVMDIIRQGEAQGKFVKVSSISDALDIPRPGVTRTVKEMEHRGYLEKKHCDTDGRVVYLTLTEEGRRISDKFDTDYFRSLLPYMEDISMEEADQMIATINKFYRGMRIAHDDLKASSGKTI